MLRSQRRPIRFKESFQGELSFETVKMLNEVKEILKGAIDEAIDEAITEVEDELVTPKTTILEVASLLGAYLPENEILIETFSAYLNTLK